ncbi:kinase-like domain-containing protein [Mycena rosella]|uniref:non-specific serine/threonine protein kinase n=1 Tax=Mycena rosella TaxID=1033263 RepID=A0AAD7CSK4_MYCRO|nr:kinase-like domain-containing protein [Mycena rosella]
MDPFIFCDIDGVEDAERYGPGGLYPVKVGDMLGPDTAAPRYRVLAKLGHGGYSTVWLANDLVERYDNVKTVAVKLVGAAETADSHEAKILERLSAPSASTPPHVLQVVDSFTVRSANGIHLVLVTEPVLLLQSFLELPGVRANMKDLLRQALEGLVFIHGRGIVHGDLHTSNLGVALPDLKTFPDTEFLLECGPPEIIPLVPSDPARDPASFPPYLAWPAKLPRFLLTNAPEFASRQPQLRILDLGNAYVARECPSPPCCTPISFVRPEVIFPRVAYKDRNGPWDRRTDIWSLASTIHEMAGGGPLFHGCGLGASLLRHMASLCGGAPQEWMQYFITVPDATAPQEMADALWGVRATHFTRFGAPKEEADALAKFLRRMLVLDPHERPSASELLQDPYFLRADMEEAPSGEH